MLEEKNYNNGLAVEILRFTMNPDLQERFLKADHDIWTIALSKEDGFISKDVWINKKKPGEITTVIYWESLEKWSAIDHKTLERVDREFNDFMGEGSFSLEAMHEGNDYYCVRETIKL
ncbi:MAG: TIGR03792 family protein [Spirochaetales bacterium]|nr:TIGR03792 family protein [Spirochaetales bacterium]